MLRPARPKRFRVHGILAASIAAGGALALAAGASAKPVINGPVGWQKNPTYTVTQAPVNPGVTTFNWNVDGGPLRGALPWGSTLNLNNVPDGLHTIGAFEFLAPNTTRQILIDRTKPTASISFVPAAATAQFGSAKSLIFGCTDASSGVAGCIATIGGTPYTSGSTLPTSPLGPKTVTVTATDKAGNVTKVSKAYTVVDTIAPSAPGLVGPLEPTGDTTPTFQWIAGADPGGSGIKEHQLKVLNAGGGTVISATINTPSVSYTPSSALANGNYTWIVTAVDKGGNATASATGSFVVDIAQASPPTITDGPGEASGAHTSDTTPSFTIGGPGPGFAWEVVDDDDDSVDAGILTSPGTITIDELDEGSYSLRAVQVSIAGEVSPEAVYVFTVDTSAPKAVNLWGRPVSPGVRPNPVFSWTGTEPDIDYAWQVAQGDKVVQGPNLTKGGQANLEPLDAGAYRFSVNPVDLAGNAGPGVDVPFVINDVPAPPTPKIAVKGTGKKRSLVIRTRNVRKLRPTVGRTLSSRRPVLRWRKTTRDTTLYNLQIFAVKGKKLVKVYSAFPEGPRFRVPNGRLGFGRTYVWQVFAYRGPVKGYLKKPIGISWFKTKSRRSNRLLLPKKANVKAAKKLTVRWKKAGKARYYRVDLMRGSTRLWARRTTGRTVRVPAAKLKAPGTYKVIVRRGTARSPKGRAYAKQAWVGKRLKVSR